jgi:7-carboxy-7-deazaguanine synthase
MEIFGPTIQGEGMVIGRKTMFVRTGGCDYQCSWCDSKFTWDGSQKATMMEPSQIWTKLKEVGGQAFDYVTISGGNPALINEPMKEFMSLLHCENIKVGLETQGSKWQDWFMNIDDLTLSPKPPSSGMETDWDHLNDVVTKLSTATVNFSFKIVVFNDEDYMYAKTVHEKWTSVPMFLSVGNGDVVEAGDVSQRLLDKLRWLTDTVVRDPSMNDIRVTPQLHVLMWGNKRGV